LLEEIEKDRILYLAIPTKAFKDIFSEPIGNLILSKNKLNLLIFDTHNQEIEQWIS
jgi:XisH protein